jgi:hypothetical protein
MNQTMYAELEKRAIEEEISPGRLASVMLAESLGVSEPVFSKRGRPSKLVSGLIIQRKKMDPNKVYL